LKLNLCSGWSPAMLLQKTEKKHIESWDKKITNYWVHKKWFYMQTPIKCKRVFPITIPTTDVWHIIIHKRSSKKNEESFIDICWNCWKLKIIGLLLHVHNTRCILHTYSSTVEILKNSIWNCLTSFSKINEYSTKKCWTSVVSTVSRTQSFVLYFNLVV